MDTRFDSWFRRVEKKAFVDPRMAGMYTEKRERYMT